MKRSEGSQNCLHLQKIKSQLLTSEVSQSSAPLRKVWRCNKFLYCWASTGVGGISCCDVLQFVLVAWL